MASDVPIAVDATKCVGCLTCCMYCSFVNQGVINPLKAYIKVVNSLEKVNDIYFTDHCNNCGVCARYCPYGALSR
jgi:Fe-S-cluster-containing dehydrogenase component